MRRDLVIVGSGLAGVSAALAAKEAGLRPLLVTSAPFLSGSSFDGASWGLGLVGPEDKADEAELCQTILDLSQGRADKALVEILVQSIPEEIARLQAMGLRFKTQADPKDKTLIPCFDHKHRAWHGLLFDETKAFFRRQLLGHIDLLEGHMLWDLQGYHSGFKLSLLGPDKIHQVTAKAVILATGGFAGLFAHAIPSPLASGLGQALGQRMGARLKNLDCIQFIPALRTPVYGCIFNERSFGLLDFGPYLEALPENIEALLEQRAAHGPYSERLPDACIDRFLFDRLQAKKATPIHYRKDIKVQGQLLEDAFRWQEARHGIKKEDAISLAPFYHAANGGLEIDRDAQTARRGLFAAGEITAGLAGKDRLGGLSTANCLVFGRRAGMKAAEYVKQAPALPTEEPSENTSPLPIEGPEVRATRKDLQDLVYKHASIRRSQAEAKQAQVQCEIWLKQLKENNHTHKIRLQLELAMAVFRDISCSF